MADRIRYSEAQIKAYYDKIALPEPKRTFNVSSLSGNEQLDYLSTLVRHHVVRIPFENLVLHYSWHRVIDTNALHVFRKIVNQPGRGGYCMENNVLLHTILLSLGFKCYTAPGRIKTPVGWTGFSHLINLVIIDGAKYLCDVGFGSNEPLVPMRLEHGLSSSQIKPTETRLIHTELAEHLSDCKMWIMQSKINDDAEWQPMYCFSELEVTPEDIRNLNYNPWIGWSSPFTKLIMCVRYTVGDKPDYASINKENIGDCEIDGILIINNDQFKWRRNGKTVLERTFKSEDERVEVLNEYWGIEFDELDREAMNDSVAKIMPRRN